jgi:hypothetical protein
VYRCRLTRRAMKYHLIPLKQTQEPAKIKTIVQTVKSVLWVKAIVSVEP